MQVRAFNLLRSTNVSCLRHVQSLLAGASMIALALPASAATLEFINGETKADPLTLSGSNTLIAGEGVGGTLAGVLSGTGGLSKTGAGTITISGDNTYSGGTDLESRKAREKRCWNLDALPTVLLFGGRASARGGTLVRIRKGHNLFIERDGVAIRQLSARLCPSLPVCRAGDAGGRC